MGKSSTTIQKREKERARQLKQQEKNAKKADNKERKANVKVDAIPGVDPDIAGIIPGPQPLPPDFAFGNRHEDL